MKNQPPGDIAPPFFPVLVFNLYQPPKRLFFVPLLRVFSPKSDSAEAFMCYVIKDCFCTSCAVSTYLTPWEPFPPPPPRSRPLAVRDTPVCVSAPPPPVPFFQPLVLSMCEGGQRHLSPCAVFCIRKARGRKSPQGGTSRTQEQTLPLRLANGAGKPLSTCYFFYRPVFLSFFSPFSPMLEGSGRSSLVILLLLPDWTVPAFFYPKVPSFSFIFVVMFGVGELIVRIPPGPLDFASLFFPFFAPDPTSSLFAVP